MAAPANFATLPTEVLLLITTNLHGSGDVNAICRLTRRLYHLFLPDVFDRSLARAKSSDDPKKPRECLVEIFLHAVKFNSSYLIQQLFCYGDIVDFRGTLPGTPFSRHAITYLHFAVTMDAPVIASQLMKHGSSSDFTLDSLSTTYPDLTPLYLSLARPNLINQRELNSALRISCSYSLPRTTSFLLARGADARTVSIYGISALHATLTRRARWKFFDEFYAYMEASTPLEKLWEQFVLQTAKSLVDFSADPRLKIDNTRVHACDGRCWKSINCDHSQQSPAHLAAGSGMVSVLRFLVQTAGLGVLDEKNGEGYTPCYAACVQGNEDAALYMLRKQAHLRNPMVRQVDGSTALHIASRFALEKVLAYLLENGAAAEINREDASGRTSLHEVLSHEIFEREVEVIGTLHLLANFGADPDHGSYPASSALGGEETRLRGMPTPRQMASRHTFISVREMFQFEQENVYRDWCDDAKKEIAVATWGGNCEGEDLQGARPGSEKGEVVTKKRRKSKKQREKAAIQEHENNFPTLEKSGAHSGKEVRGHTMANPNVPNSFGAGAQLAKESVESKGNQAPWTASLGVMDNLKVQPVLKDAGEQEPGDAGLGKGKRKGGGGKNKWKKMEL